MSTRLIAPEETASVSVDGTKYTPNAEGVFDINNGSHVAILTRPPFGFTEAAEDTTNPAESMLLGSSILSSMVDVGGEEPLQLGEVVRRAHEASGLSVAEWNAMPEDERERRLEEIVQALRDENEPGQEDADALRAAEIEALRAVDPAAMANRGIVAKWLNDHGDADAKSSEDRDSLDEKVIALRDRLIAELEAPAEATE